MQAGKLGQLLPNSRLQAQQEQRFVISLPESAAGLPDMEERLVKNPGLGQPVLDRDYSCLRTVRDAKFR